MADPLWRSPKGVSQKRDPKVAKRLHKVTKASDSTCGQKSKKNCDWIPSADLPARHLIRARKKPINTNILGGTVSGTNRNRPWDKRDPIPGTNWGPSLGQTGRFLFNSTVKSPFCPVCPWDGWGFVPGTIVPQGPSEKCLCVFCLLVFFAPNWSKEEIEVARLQSEVCTDYFSWSEKSLGVHKILVLQKLVLPPPPPKRAQKEEKLYKSVKNPQNRHFFRGGERRFCGQNDFMDIWAFLFFFWATKVLTKMLRNLPRIFCAFSWVHG